MRFLIPRKTVLAFALLALGAPFSLRAELPADVVEILEASIVGSGGRETLSQITTSRLSGTMAIEAMNLAGTTELVLAYPDKVFNAVELQGMGRSVQAFDGSVGWAEDPLQGFRYLSDGEIAALKQNELFGDMLDFEQTYSFGKRLPDVEVGGEQAAVLELVTAATGESELHYYSQESGLMLRLDTEADMGPMGKIPASMVIKAYGEQGGVKYPALMEMKNAGIVITMTFNSLELNPVIDDSLFAEPR